MLFNSFEFIIFLPVVFALYWILKDRLQFQNGFLLLASYLFYGWWDWRFLSLIILSSLVDFTVGRQLGKQENNIRKKRWLLISIFTNIGLLAFFKYFNFFVDQLIYGFGTLGITLNVHTLSIILPVGISFYTFQTLSYTIDVYRGKIRPVDNWVIFFTYVGFFPQLVAGPIERAGNLIPQFSQPRKFDYLLARDGMQQILWGLFKKVVIADNCAQVVDMIFSGYTDLGTGGLILGVVLFAIQIYCDFSGYSDIAIGVARLFGFDLMQNFNYPYFSRDIAEFWRRWHISLSTWFRDYVYIPLGGSRVKAKSRLILNVLVIFLVSGFWHGANWTFIIWGLLHAFFFLPNILSGRNRRYTDEISKGKYLPTRNDFISMLKTFLLVSFAWIFFRAEDLNHAIKFIGQLLTNLEFNGSIYRKNIFLLLGILILMVIEWLQRTKSHALQIDQNQFGKMTRLGIYIVIVFSIVLFGPSESSTFIYFQF